MKKLKSFENFNEEDSEYGKYCLFNTGYNNVYYIFEITDIKDDFDIKLYTITYTTSYDENKGFHIDELVNNKSTFYYEDDMRKKVLYHNNDLNKVKDKTQLIANSNKYNL